MTDSPLFGATRNPWDLSRTAGGSSGGAAAAVATRPGAAGARHRRGRLHSPPRVLLRHRRPQAHARARPARAAGRSLLHDVLHRTHGANAWPRPPRASTPSSGFDPGDPYSRPEPLDDPRDADVRGLRIGWLPRVGNRLVDPDVLKSCEAAVRHLEGHGAVVETVEEDVMAFEQTFLVFFQGGLAARVGPHMAAFGDKIARSLRESVERGARWSAVDWANALGQRTAMYRRVQALFRRFDFLVSPTISRPALPLDHDPFEPITIGGETAGSIRGAWYPYLWPFNLSGHPAVSLPCGWSADGLPIGLQIVGPWYADRRVLTLAAQLERERPCGDRCPSSRLMKPASFSTPVQEIRHAPVAPRLPRTADVRYRRRDHVDRPRSQERRASHRDEPGGVRLEGRHAADPRSARGDTACTSRSSFPASSWSSGRRWSTRS